LIGICGTAMASLAGMLVQQGHEVSGSDENVYPPMSVELQRLGIPVREGYSPENLAGRPDIVVVGNAITRGNPELEYVLNHKLHYTSMAAVVKDNFIRGHHSIVVAGTHGKTTTTSLMAWALERAGANPSFLIGGVAENFNSSFRVTDGPFFAIEGDEYDTAYFDKGPKFMHYLPDTVILNNVEFDHADIYENLDAIRVAFRRFVNLVPRRGLTLLGADSADSIALRDVAKSRVETFGLSEAADWRAEGLKVGASGTTFHVRRQGTSFGEFTVPLLGAHNVRNALAALATAAELGLGPQAIATGLDAFAGVKRRLELRGSARGIRVYDDFAHHPTAIAETISALRLAHPEARIWAVFEPRSATSCLRIFQPEFVDALALADETIVAAVFRSSLADDRRLSPEEVVASLRAAGHRARYISAVPDIVDIIAREARPGDLVVIMSNGGFDGIHGKLMAALDRERIDA
jgi:UDP-N-acetylmuramate: L-alanyl-gamma-D-glutamyl-meso-diaminopimelate ligase